MSEPVDILARPKHWVYEKPKLKNRIEPVRVQLSHYEDIYKGPLKYSDISKATKDIAFKGDIYYGVVFDPKTCIEERDKDRFAAFCQKNVFIGKKPFTFYKKLKKSTFLTTLTSSALSVCLRYYYIGGRRYTVYFTKTQITFAEKYRYGTDRYAPISFKVRTKNLQIRIYKHRYYFYGAPDEERFRECYEELFADCGKSRMKVKITVSEKAVDIYSKEFQEFKRIYPSLYKFLFVFYKTLGQNELISLFFEPDRQYAIDGYFRMGGKKIFVYLSLNGIQIQEKVPKIDYIPVKSYMVSLSSEEKYYDNKPLLLEDIKESMKDVTEDKDLQLYYYVTFNPEDCFKDVDNKKEWRKYAIYHNSQFLVDNKFKMSWGRGVKSKKALLEKLENLELIALNHHVGLKYYKVILTKDKIIFKEKAWNKYIGNAEFSIDSSKLLVTITKSKYYLNKKYTLRGLDTKINKSDLEKAFDDLKKDDKNKKMKLRVQANLPKSFELTDYKFLKMIEKYPDFKLNYEENPDQYLLLYWIWNDADYEKCKELFFDKKAKPLIMDYTAASKKNYVLSFSGVNGLGVSADVIQFQSLNIKWKK